MTADLSALIARLEAAEAGNVLLDLAIWHAVEFDGSRNEPPDAQRYTTSLDAALALAERVLPGWVWNMGNDLPCWVHLWIDDRNYDGDPIKGDASTPALALCIAILRAKAQEG